MKRIEEKVVPENVDIVATIVELAEKNKSWIYISHSLMERLMQNYPHYEYRSSQEGEIFECSNYELLFYVDKGWIWNMVRVIPKPTVSIATDPDVIYLLS